MTSENNPLEIRSLQQEAGRRMIPAACSNCHDRKVRCDAHKRGFPCSPCINFQRPSCHKHEKKKRNIGRGSSHFAPLGKKSTDEASTAASEKNLPEPSDSHSKPGISPRSDLAESPSNSHLVEYVDQQEVRNRSVLRGVRISYLGQDVSNMNFLIRQRNMGENDNVHHVPFNDIAGRFITHGPDHIPKDAFTLPERKLGDQLVNAYFTHVNPGCPLVDEDIFMEQYRKNPAESPSLLVLQAIYLVGAHASRDRPDRDNLKAMFFRRAKILYDSRLEQNRDFIIQAALLLTWHSDGPDDTEANAWFWVGIAARTAMGLGLHRDRIGSNIIHIDMRTWRRIWWILVQFDVAVSLFYGRPQAINLDESDVPPLTSSDFEGCGPNVQIDYIIKRTELCILISKVLRERFGLRVSEDDQNIALGHADQSLANWNLSLPAILQLQSSNTNLWVASLHLTYNNFLIILHRPHPTASTRTTDHGVNDSDICSSAANIIATIFEELRAKDQIKYLWISDINSLFTTMVQISVELRFSNPILAINALRRFDSTLLSLRSLIEYWTNAEWILRVFEESSLVQHGIRLGNRTIQPDQSSRNSAAKTHEAEAVYAEPGVLNPDLDFFVGERDAGGLSGSIVAPSTDPIGWGETMPQTDMNTQDLSMTDGVANTIPLDNEWREIYWQEPGISESFADGLWGWP